MLERVRRPEIQGVRTTPCFGPKSMGTGIGCCGCEDKAPTRNRAPQEGGCRGEMPLPLPSPASALLSLPSIGQIPLEESLQGSPGDAVLRALPWGRAGQKRDTGAELEADGE